uniref:J domain-containing protein n=1 Tax=Brassica campestris TaxID=3711 RepID=M4DA93_BRACM
MECNKDEAKRAMDIAEKKLSEKDYVGAKKFLTKAQNLYPHLDGLNQVSTMIHVYVSAANNINGGKDSDLYGVLGVDPLADDEALKKQYKKLALLLHPDKNKCKGAEGAFKHVLNAWALLSDKAKRSAYDRRRKLSTGMQKPPAPSQQNKPQGSSNVYQNVYTSANTRSNQPGSGPQRPPPYVPKTASASGPQRPTYAPKPASSSGNPNASRNGVPPNGNTRSNHPPSGPQNPHKPASSNVNQNARYGMDPNAKATSNKPAPAPARTYAPGPSPAPGPGPGPAPTPANSSKQMFWTMCNGCKRQSECQRALYQNKTMRCQNCGQSYIATEQNPWDHYVRQLNRALYMIGLRQWSSSSSSAHQNQAANKNTNGASGATKKNHPWESHVSQINRTLSLVVLRQAHWNAQNQAAKTNNGGGPVPDSKFTLQQVFSTFSSILQLQQQWSAAEKNNGRKGAHASFVSPGVNLSSSSPQQQQQCGGGTYYPSSSGSVHHKSSVSIPSSSGNAASQAKERSKRGLEEDSQETIAAAIESVSKKLRKDHVV